jgi:ABC-type glycerol-3-phosphate transport system substrate-binding protein
MYPGSVNFTHEDTRLAFTQGIGAMIATSTSYLFPFDRDVPQWFNEGKIAATGIPINKLGREGTWIGYNSLCVVDGPKIEAAKQFVKFVMRKDNAVKYFSNNVAGHIPALSAVYEDPGFWQARAKFESTYRAALESVKVSKWDEPVVPWSGIFFSRAGRDKVMENIYVNKWSTDQVKQWLVNTMTEVKSEWKD